MRLTLRFRDKYRPLQREFSSIVNSLKQRLGPSSGPRILRKFEELTPRRARPVVMKVSPSVTRNQMKSVTTTLDLGSRVTKEEAGEAVSPDKVKAKEDPKMMLEEIRELAASLSEVKKENQRIETDIQCLEKLDKPTPK